jgi:hypothetical protein
MSYPYQSSIEVFHAAEALLTEEVHVIDRAGAKYRGRLSRASYHVGTHISNSTEVVLDGIGAIDGVTSIEKVKEPDPEIAGRAYVVYDSGVKLLGEEVVITRSDQQWTGKLMDVTVTHSSRGGIYVSARLEYMGTVSNPEKIEKVRTADDDLAAALSEFMYIPRTRDAVKRIRDLGWAPR